MTSKFATPVSTSSMRRWSASRPLMLSPLLAEAFECHPFNLLDAPPQAKTEPERALLELFRGMSDEQQDAFEGKMTSSKWAKIGKCSQDSANRDIAVLLKHGLMKKGPGGGRSTHYAIVSEGELLKGVLTKAFGAPDSSYSALSASDVITRNAG